MAQHMTLNGHTHVSIWVWSLGDKTPSIHMKSDFASDSDLRLVCCNVNIFNSLTVVPLFFIIFNILNPFAMYAMYFNSINTHIYKTIVICNCFRFHLF